MSDKILKLNQAQTLYNDLRERIEALPTDNDIPTKISDLTDDSGHYIKPATGIPASDLEEEIVSTIDSKAPAIYCEKSGAIISFDDGAGNMSLKDCVVQIEPVQSGSGDPSPTNIRPITGRTGCNVLRAGKNLMDPNAAATKGNFTGDGAIGTASATYVFGIPCARNTDYTLYLFNDELQYRVGLTNDYPAVGVTVDYLATRNVTSIYTLNTGEYDYIAFATSAIDKIGGTMLVLGSDTAKPYKPYAGQTYPITFPTEAGTVYGGTLDVGRGVLTVTNGMIASYAGETLPGEWISDRDVYEAGTTPTTGAQVVYELAEPITYTLAPQEICTLLGTNNIWADTGDISVTYPADTKMFVEQNTPESPVQDVQINGTSILQDGVANVPIADANNPGAVIVRSTSDGLIMYNGRIEVSGASAAIVRVGTSNKNPIVPGQQHASTFYGLAKVAGADMKDMANTPVGVYPDAQKEAIQSMLGITQMLAPENPNLIASQAYAIGDVFAANGKLYKATAAIAQDEAIIPDTNCVETTMVDAGGRIRDVQVNGTSVVSNGVANVPMADSETFGVVKVTSTRGVSMSNGLLTITPATEAMIKAGTDWYKPLGVRNLPDSVFYGLSKVAGVDLANETVTLGTYPETSKTAIKEMLGVQDGLKVVRLI